MSSNSPLFPAPLFPNLEQAATPQAALGISLNNWSDVGVDEQQKAELLMACTFLLSFRGSADSFNSYRKQLEKLFLWAWVHHKTVYSLTGSELEEFIEFTNDPVPRAAWVADANYRKFTKDGPNPKWRPFVAQGGKYSQGRKSVQSLFASIGSFYGYAVQAGEIPFNPVDAIRQKSKFSTRMQHEKVRRYDNEFVEIMFDICEEKCADENEIIRNKWERARWCLHLLLTLYLRISEIVETINHRPMQSDFSTDKNSNTWLRVIGKGNKERHVTIPDQVSAALSRYRESLGLAPKPRPGDPTPMVPRLDNPTESISSTRQLRRIMEEIFKETSEVIAARYSIEDANAFLQGTVHWLRHTGVSEDVKYRPKEHVSLEAGHESTATTDRYIDIERSEIAATRKESSKKVFGR